MLEFQFNPGRLSELFKGAIENSRDDRIMSTWHCDNQTEILQAAENCAACIFKGTSDIMSEKTVHEMEQEFKKLFSSETDREVTFTEGAIKALDEEIGKYVVKAQSSAEKRILWLIHIARQCGINWKTGEYFRHISQCYLLGLDEQTLIMCRAALDASFEESIPDKLCKEFNARSNYDGTYPLASRMYAAREGSVLSDGLFDKAYEIKEFANFIIHPQNNNNNNKRIKFNFSMQSLNENINEYLFWTVSIVEELTKWLDKNNPKQ